MNRWKDYFLVGNDHYSKPYVVAFRVYDDCDSVCIYGYKQMYGGSMVNYDLLHFPPLFPSALATIITTPRINTTKYAARIIWQDLLNHKQYNMRETSFSALCPNHVFDPVEMEKNTKRFTLTDNHFVNNQYALQA